MRLQFDDLTFDDDTRQLWVRGEEIRLSPKAFDLLALLVARRPNAVSKTDIRGHLWPRTLRVRRAACHRSCPRFETRSATIGENLASCARCIDSATRSRPSRLPMPHQAAAAIAGPNAWLLGRTAEVALLPGENILGREGDGIILVKSSTVSRRHARIVIDAKGAVIEDLKSKNGTFVNDRRVSGPTPDRRGRSGPDWIVAVHVPPVAGLAIRPKRSSRTRRKRLHP